jgi:hypothetical protein
MDHYYEMKNMLPQSHGYQPVENGHNADDRELKQVGTDTAKSSEIYEKSFDFQFDYVYFSAFIR